MLSTSTGIADEDINEAEQDPVRNGKPVLLIVVAVAVAVVDDDDGVLVIIFKTPFVTDVLLVVLILVFKCIGILELRIDASS